MSLNNIGKVFRIGLLAIYPLLAIAIWFIPMLETVPTFNKIALSTLFVLYGALRIYRLSKKPSHNEESE